MECNKEEAIRAREIAEKRLCCQDYAGAKEMALKAKKLYPQLDNLSQLLTVCEVHCSARLMANGLQDWYKIIQVDPVSDEILIRQQYRKLVLLLHPDKNKCPGADTAFKLVREAKDTLSDRVKRIMYDLKRRHLVRSAGSQESTEASSTHSSSSKSDRADKWKTEKPPEPQSHQGISFYSACPTCLAQHHYYLHMLNKKVCCTNCSIHFIAAAPVHLNPELYKYLNQARHFTDQQQPQKLGSYRFTCDQGGGTPRDITGVSEPDRNTNNPISNLSSPHTITVLRNSKKVSSNTSQNPNPRSKPNLNLGFEKRRTKGGRADDGAQAAATSTPLPRSPCNKHDVKYNGTETGHSRPRTARAEVNRVRDDNCGTNATDSNSNASNCDMRVVKEQNSEREKEREGEQQADPRGLPKENETAFRPSRSSGVKGAERAANAGILTMGCNSSQPNADAGFLYEYPDAEFHNFYTHRTSNIFEQGHIWALYSDLDTLPKYYGLICKVEHNPFRVHVSWLDACPKYEVERVWLDASFPISCGKFRVTTQNTIYDKPEYFSHMVSARHHVQGNCYDILPEAGKIWAIYKNWSPVWTLHDFKTCNFEILEIVEQREESTIVCPLRQVPGYTSVFMSEQVGGTGSMREVPACEYILFSHKIPAIRLTEECGGKLKGFWELDPASVPYAFFNHDSDFVCDSRIRKVTTLLGR